MKAMKTKKWIAGMLMLLSTMASSTQAASGIIDLDSLPNYANQSVPSYITRDNTPANNPITDTGATLGRVLFYDKQLSSNNTVSCSTCHQQGFAFGDPLIASQGVNGTTGRHSMRLINARFSDEANFFWDERVPSAEEQVTKPIQDHNEMGFSGTNDDPTFADLITKMEGLNYYPRLFEEVFGDTAITEDRMKLAIAQFVRSIQSFDSKYDQGRAVAPNDPAPFPNFTAQENTGKNLFFQPPTFTGSTRTGGGGGCAGCHQSPEFSITPNSGNNGAIQAIGGGTDRTNTRSPSLRDLDGPNGSNGPFMHDGNDATIEDVIDHYSTGISGNQGLDGRLRRSGSPVQFNFTSQEVSDLAAFLRTLTGSNVYTDQKWADPFDVNGNLEIHPIVKQTPSVSLSSTPNPSDIGEAFTITATVSGTSGTPTGSITFNNGESNVSTVTLDGNAQATYSSSSYSVGTHSFTASYSGDSAFNAASSSSLTQTIELPPNNNPVANAGSDQSVVVGEIISLNGTFTDADGSDIHSFAWDLSYNGENFVASRTSQNTTTSFSTPGTYTIIFKVTDQRNGSDQDSMTVTVTKAEVVATITSHTPNPAETDQTITLTATFVPDSPGGGTVTGTARWYEGESYLGESIVSSGSSSFQTSFDTAGTYENVFVYYLGDTSYQSANSANITQVVEVPKEPVTVHLTASMNPAIEGETIQFRAFMEPSSSSAAATGDVKFYNGSTLIGTDAPDADSEAFLYRSNLPIGTHSITAVFQGDEKYKATTSTELSLEVYGGYDFGDAPEGDPGYPVLLSQEGARHKITNLYLGSGATKEDDGQPSTNADADTDDGVQVPTLQMGTTVDLIVTASQSGFLDGWIDWNQNESWNDAEEQFIQSIAVTAGQNIIPFTVPCYDETKSFNVRFRLSTAGSLLPTGEAADGEVEDYVFTMIDNQAPTLNVPDDIIVNNDTGVCGAVVNYTVSTSDNCGTPTITSSSGPELSLRLLIPDPEPGNDATPSGSTFDFGTTVMTFTATDDHGNATTKTFKITVNDTEAPVVSGPSNTTIPADAGQCSALYTYTITATDNCSSVMFGTLEKGLTSGSSFPVGTTLVEWSYQDGSGNKGTHSFTVTVTETTAPEFNLRTTELGNNIFTKALDLNGSATLSASDLVADWSDCSDVAFSLSKTSFSGTDIGDNSVTITATDTSGNQSTETATIRIYSTMDLGDAPDSYGTLISSDGPRHGDGDAPFLGSRRDVEGDGNVSSGSGDDLDDEVSDEDGVGFGEFLRGSEVAIDITASGPGGRLDAWIDWNGDGVFAHPAEQIASDIAMAAGANQLNVSVPSDIDAGATYARFRLSPEGGLSPKGATDGGEVEDYRIIIEANALPPVVTMPQSDTAYAGQLPVEYKLPETAVGDGVGLSFLPQGSTWDDRRHGIHYGLPLTSAGQTVSFNFDPASPESNGIITGNTPLPQGTYDLWITYSSDGTETGGYAILRNLSIDGFAQAATFIAPSHNAKFADTLAISIELPEAARSGNLLLQFDSSNNANDRILILSDEAISAGTHSFIVNTDDLDSVSEVASVSGGDSLEEGAYIVRLQYIDLAGNVGYASSIFNVERVTNDPTLASISVSGGSLSPEFSASSLSYTINLPYGSSSLEIQAVPNSSSTSITFSGKESVTGTTTARYGIPVGSTSISIRCQAEGNEVLVYNVLITRELPQQLTTQITSASIFDATLNTPLIILASDIAGDSYTAPEIQDEAPASQAGGTFVRNDVSSITYTPPADFVGNDQAVITFSSQGQTYTALIRIRVSGDQDVKLSHAKVTDEVDGNDVDVTFAGLPGETYLLQASNDLSGWLTISTLTAGPDGKLVLTDPNARRDHPARFYRVVLQIAP